MKGLKMIDKNDDISIRDMNPLHIAPGEYFYTIEEQTEYVPCEYCGGTQMITTQTGLELNCPICNDEGKRRKHKGYEIREHKCTCIDYNRYLHEWLYRGENGKVYYYNNDDSRYNAYQNNAYQNRIIAEKALEKFLKERDIK